MEFDSFVFSQKILASECESCGHFLPFCTVLQKTFVLGDINRCSVALKKGQYKRHDTVTASRSLTAEMNFVPLFI